MNKTQSTVAIILIIALIGIIAFQFFNKEEAEENPRILELEAEKRQLKAEKAAQFQLFVTASNEADSLLMAIKIQSDEDNSANKEKHEIIRNDIILLTDTQSVQLLSANIRRKRAANNN